MKKTIHLIIAIITILSALTAAAKETTCPSKNQKILVIDLKSGWWQGDGGDTHEIIAQHLKNNCANVSLEYRHSTYGGYGSGGFGGELNQMDPLASGPNKFPSEPFENYNQVWLLSGGEADGVDLRTDSREFQRYVEGIKNSNSNLFIGTGFGNVYHANALTAALGLDALVATDKETHVYPQAASGSRVISRLIYLKFTPDALFSQIEQLPDAVRVGEYDVTPDWLVASDLVTKLAVNEEGKTVIARVNLPNRKLIVDTNLARTYMIRHDDRDVAQYLLNLVVALEK